MKTRFHINTLLVGALMVGFTACADEEIVKTSAGLTGQLHIGEVKLGDKQLATRAIVEGQKSALEPFPYNQEIIGFSDNDKLSVAYNFQNSQTDFTVVTATYTSGSFNFDGTPIIKPTADTDKWEKLSISVTFTPGGNTDFVKTFADDDKVVGFTTTSGTVTEQRAYYDKLEASTTYISTTATPAAGYIDVVRDLKSQDLGKMTVTFRHAHALLRLPFDDTNISINTMHKGAQVTGKDKLATLWAELKKNTEKIYLPLTSVTINSVTYLQAIAPVDYNLMGFKVVLKNGTENFTVDLPFTTGNTQNGAEMPQDGYGLDVNTQYNLNLTINPKTSVVELQKNVKPGWSVDTVLKDWKSIAANQLKYANGTFEVSGPLGFLLLNQWMTGEGDEISAIFGYDALNKGARRLSHNIKLTGNINLNDGCTIDNVNYTSEQLKLYDLDGEGTEMSNWKPLGGSGNEYTGTFDGNGNTITGLTVITSNGCAGLTDRLGEGGIIKNLTIDDATVNTTDNHTGIISCYTAGIIENCKVINSSVEGTGDYVGAIAGTNNGTIIACEVSGKTTVKGASHVAGIAASNSGSIVACSTKHDWSSNGTNNLTLNATATDTSKRYSAGLVSNNTGGVYGCWTTKVNNETDTGYGIYDGQAGVNNISASAIGNAMIGSPQNPAETTMNYAIALYNASLELTNPAYCKWHWNDTPALENGAPAKTFNAAYVPESKSFKVATYDGLKQICEWMWKGRKAHNANYNTYLYYFDPDDLKNNDDVTTDDNVDNPMLSSVPGFESNMNDEASLSERCKYNITLTSDIDLTSVGLLYDLDGVDGLDSNWLYLFGDGTSYEGTFDGAGHTIKGLKIMSNRSQTGLVDVLGPNGVIKNLTLDSPEISGIVDGTGFFVSANNGIVENCHIIGTSKMEVTCSSSRHAFDNGAIVGQNAGVVMACTVSGTLSMKGCYSFGGIVGANRNGYVVACRNTSTLNVTQACSHDTQYTGSPCVGSLVGINCQTSTTTVNGVTTETIIEGYVYGSYSNTSGVLVGDSSGGEYKEYTGSKKIGVSNSSTDVDKMNEAIDQYNASPKFGKSCAWRWDSNMMLLN